MAVLWGAEWAPAPLFPTPKFFKVLYRLVVLKTLISSENIPYMVLYPVSQVTTDEGEWPLHGFSGFSVILHI